MSRRADALRYSMTLLHQPYRWGGYNPQAGFDCSGQQVEVLKMSDTLPRGRKKDWTAGGLLAFFEALGIHPTEELELVGPGWLLFWLYPSGKVRHVEMCITRYGDHIMTIGASGGGSDTVTVEVALARDARVKIRRAYPGWIALDPFAGDAV